MVRRHRFIMRRATKRGWRCSGISRDGYLFYNDLNTILNSDGGMFSPPPANPRSNVTGGALGFFQVSAMDECVDCSETGIG